MVKKLIIFDLDGTLFLTKESYRFILSALMERKYGKSSQEILKSYNYAESLMNKNKEYPTAEDFFRDFNSIFLKQIGIEPNDKNLKELEDIVSEMKRRAPTELKMYPSAKTALENLKKKGYKIALLTGSWDKKIERFTREYIRSKVDRVNKLLENSEINYLFNHIFVGYANQILKPNPKAFRDVLTHFNVRANEAIMIGDSEPDMKASDIGITTILFDPEGEYSQETLPDYRFKHYSELLKLIEKIE